MLRRPSAIHRADGGGMTMGENPTRRHVLAAGSLLGLAATPAFAAVEPEDPLLPLHREWWTARQEWLRLARLPGNEDWDLPESLAAEAREDAAYKAMHELTPTSMAGIAALAHVLWTVAGPSAPEDLVDAYVQDCEKDECKLIAAIWRASSGETGTPPFGEVQP